MKARASVGVRFSFQFAAKTGRKCMGMRMGVEGVSDRAITGRVLAGIKRSHAGERFALEELKGRAATG